MRRRTILFLWLAVSLAGCHYSWAKRMDLWRKKLRVRTPVSYSPITVDELIDLEPGCPFHESDVPAINQQEKRAVIMEGYLVNVEQLADGKTYAHLVRRGDIHLQIASSPDFEPAAGSAERVICEVTVPFQWRHQRWNLEGLAPLAGSVSDKLISHSYPGGTPGGARIRVAGYLLDDFVHCAAVDKTRATAWEIHPITKLEVWNDQRGRFETLP